MINMMKSSKINVFRSIRRRFSNSSTSFQSIPIRNKATIRDLVSAPLMKSLLLTIIFGSSVIEYMKSNRELKSLENNYKLQLKVLEELKEKLETNTMVDVSSELKLIKSLHKHTYTSLNDLDSDAELEKFLAEANFDERENVEQNLQKDQKVTVDNGISVTPQNKNGTKGTSNMYL